MKFVIYSVAVTCFVVAGAMDLLAEEWRSGIIALLLAALNAMIFLWK